MGRLFITSFTCTIDQLAQQVSHEESDLMLASSLAQTEMRHMKELQRQRALLNAQVCHQL